LELISDLVDISRLETGLIAPELTSISWDGIMEGCVEVARGVSEPLGIEIVEEIEPDLPDIFASEVRLSQLINNLVSNSARYTPSGGKIYIKAREEGDNILVCVEDEGGGIEPDALPHIFEDFYKGDPESKEGTGLGLSICKRIVDMHHGDIWAESPIPETGKGTRIAFTIPKGAICDLTYWERKEEGES
jgi:two-component system sensor histidine kinase BaeS